MWAYAQKLVERMMTAVDQDTFLDDSLDLLVELFGADRGLILLSDSSGASLAVNARGRGRALSPLEREEISRTLVSQVQKSGRGVAWEPDIGGGGAGSASMRSFGIITALAAPLRPVALTAGAGGERGVIYLDFRDARREIGPAHLEFLETAASLVSIVLDQHQKLELTREDLRAALAHESGGARPPTLEDLLTPRSMDGVRAELDACLHSELPLLVLGESGTGKTLLARAVAAATGREPVVRATLGSSDDLNTITSELFGHERGAFSGALGKRVGLVEYADGGVLILDEVLNLPPHAQQLLLDFTQFGTFRPLGWSRAEPKRARVRLIAATNGDLPAAIAAGRFREDLYYRLSAVTLTLPPLRERRDEIPALAEGFLRRLDPTREWRLAPELRRALLAPELVWPGNMRQLEAMLTRARLRAVARDPQGATLDATHLDLREAAPRAGTSPPAASAPPATAPAVGDLGESWRRLQARRAALEEEERALLGDAMQKHAGVVARAAQELGLARTSLVSRLQTLKVRSS
jgi:transcriptional regulator with GAF, ATPase, and Fis domain